MNHIGSAIRKIRQSQGMSLTTLADLTGRSKSFLSLLEKGDRIPSLATLAEIAQGLNVRLTLIFAVTEFPESVHQLEKYLEEL